MDLNLTRSSYSACRILGITNLYTSVYHPQTNGQVERYNRTIASMLRNYVNEHQDDWDVYVGPLTYAYNSHAHLTTRTTLFELVLSRAPPEFSLRRMEDDGPFRIDGIDGIPQEAGRDNSEDIWQPATNAGSLQTRFRQTRETRQHATQAWKLRLPRPYGRSEDIK